MNLRNARDRPGYALVPSDTYVEFLPVDDQGVAKETAVPDQADEVEVVEVEIEVEVEVEVEVSDRRCSARVVKAGNAGAVAFLPLCKSGMTRFRRRNDAWRKCIAVSRRTSDV